MTVSRSRVLVAISIVFVGAVLFVGYNAYKAFWGGIDSDYKLQISKEIEEINKAIGEDLTPKEEGGETLPDEPSPKPEESAKPPAPSEPDVQRIQSVVTAYESGIRKLQDQGNGVVNGLIADAKAEYAALKQAGAGKSALLNMAVSYMGKATAMEKEIDAGFNKLIAGAAIELKAAGMPQADIDTYISNLKEAYKQEKDSRRNALLDKAKSYL